MLRLRIVSPESIVYQGQAISVKVPGTSGNFEILKDHAPIISSLQKGKVEYVNDEGRHELEINGGFVEVQKNLVSLCIEVL
jgi:F-type H+-transporting ATPase subunit epsilon